MNLEELIAKLNEGMQKLEAFEAKENLTDEETKEFETLLKEHKALDTKIELMKHKAMLADRVDDKLLTDEANAKATLDAVNAQEFNKFMASGGTNLSEIKNTMVLGSPTNGAVLVPDQYANEIIKLLERNTAVRKYATVMRTNGTFNMPVGDDRAVAGWIDELGTYPTSDVKFSNLQLEAFKNGVIIKVSEELLADNSFNLQGYLVEQIADATGWLEGEAFISGDGVKKPTGLLQGIAADKKETLAILDTITAADVEDLYLKVHNTYRKRGTWIISDKFFKAVFKLKDSNGNPIWSQGFNAGEPGRLFNRPYEIDDTMTGETGEPLAFFGDISRYKIGDRGQMAIQRAEERYMEEGVVAFKVYKRVDGKLTKDDSVAALINA